MELVDVVDSKSTAGDSVPVRVRPPAFAGRLGSGEIPLVCFSFFSPQASDSALGIHGGLLKWSKRRDSKWAWVLAAFSVETS